MAVNLMMIRLWTFAINSCFIYITSSFPAQSFRIQSIRPFVAKNINSLRLDMTDEFSSVKYSSPLVTQPDQFQKDAVICTDHAVMIVAGPGSGKTRVMAARLAHLLQSGNCSPKECLVISFTSSAATNLLEKTKDLLKKSESVATTNGVYCDTFHGFCSTVIKENVDCVMNSKKGFNIASDDEQTKIMTEIMELKGLNPNKAEVRNILTKIRYWKECGLGYLGVRKNTLGTATEKRAYDLYPNYQRKLISGSFLDFGDLLLSTLRLFRENTDVLDKYRSRFRHILIDEFQDVSPAQYDILRILVLGSTNAENDDQKAQSQNKALHAIDRKKYQIVNVFCAGDDDQSIYADRGAKVELMHRFKFDFPGCRVLKFGTSYRLPEAICTATQSFISSGKIERIPKVLVSGKSSSFISVDNYLAKDLQLPSIKLSNSDDDRLNMAAARAPIEVRGMENEEDEINWIVSYLHDKTNEHRKMVKEHSEKKQQGNIPFSSDYSVVILTRHAKQLRVIEERLKQQKITFFSRNYGSWDYQAECTSPLNLLRLIASPDDDAAFQSALDNDIIRLTVDYDDIEKEIMPVVREVSASRGLSLLDSARECVLTRKLSPLYSEALTRFLQKFEAWSSSQERHFKKGDINAIYAIFQSAYSLRWDSVQKDVLRVCNSASGYNSLKQFFAAIKFEGDFIEESRYQEMNNKERNNEGNSYESIDYGSMNQSVGKEKEKGDYLSGSGENVPSLKIWAMVMHASKGLEYDEVILPFWSAKSEMDTTCPIDRKVAFVSLTRAKERVMISYSNTIRKSLTVDKCGPSNLVNALLSIPGIQLIHEKNVDMGAITPYGMTDNLNSKTFDPKNSKNNLKRLKIKSNSYNDNYDNSKDYTGPPSVQVIGTTRNVGGSTKEKGKNTNLANLAMIPLPPTTIVKDSQGDFPEDRDRDIHAVTQKYGVKSDKDIGLGEIGSKVSNGENESPGHPLLCTYLRDVMKGDEPPNFLPSSVVISHSHTSTNAPQDATENVSVIECSVPDLVGKATSGRATNSLKRIIRSNKVGGEYSSSNILHNIITETVIINTNKKEKKEKKSREEILLKFSAIDILNPSIINGLMNDKAVLKMDLEIYFRESLKELFQFTTGSVPIGEKVEKDGIMKKITRSFSTCTSTQLGNFLIELMIKKRSSSF